MNKRDKICTNVPRNISKAIISQEIISRIRQLGGKTDHVKGTSLREDILSITFDTVLYQRPVDTPWAKAEDMEPIYGIGQFFDDNKNLFEKDEQAFYDKLIDKYYRLTEEGYGQMFWTAQLFTPFKEGTEDFDEWNDMFVDNEDIDLSEVIELTHDRRPDFIQVFYNYGFPDHYYICLSDPNPENPTLFGTDHEVFFSEITNEGTLEDFLSTFMTKKELIEIIKGQVENEKF